MEKRASNSTTSQYKACDKYLDPNTPVVHTDTIGLTRFYTEKLFLYDQLDLNKFRINEVNGRIFIFDISSDRTNGYILQLEQIDCKIQ